MAFAAAEVSMPVARAPRLLRLLRLPASEDAWVAVGLGTVGTVPQIPLPGWVLPVSDGRAGRAVDAGIG
jgi:hypothetical protein